MEHNRDSECLDVWLDLVCYEILSRRLSPEMKEILKDHLRNCASCRRKVLGFRQILGEGFWRPNFG